MSRSTKTIWFAVGMALGSAIVSCIGGCSYPGDDVEAEANVNLAAAAANLGGGGNAPQTIFEDKSEATAAVAAPVEATPQAAQEPTPQAAAEPQVVVQQVTLERFYCPHCKRNFSVPYGVDKRVPDEYACPTCGTEAKRITK